MSLHTRLLERDRQSVTLRNILGNTETYEILALFPFSSETKKMSMLVKHKESGRYIYYLKGAEVVMENKVRPAQKSPVQEFCESLAMEGLRTLVIAQKVMTEEQVERFLIEYKEASGRMRHREKSIQAVLHGLETDLDFLGVTGVEDKL